MGGLHGEGHADTEGGQGHHGHGLHADPHHLVKDRIRADARLAPQWCDKDPVKDLRVEGEKLAQPGHSEILFGLKGGRRGFRRVGDGEEFVQPHEIENGAHFFLQAEEGDFPVMGGGFAHIFDEGGEA